MGLSPDGEKISVSKKNVPAHEYFERIKEKNNIVPTRVMGAHTRAATQGDPKDNRNNHPVYFNGIWVTHNGTIRNDDQVRKLVSPKQRGKLPEVDTVAINIVLNEVKGPFDEDSLGDALYDELNGGYAFHAMWKEYPGVSLIAKGTSSPLVVAYQQGAFFYGSELESVWHMINALGLDDKEFTWREMENYVYFVVQDGVIVNTQHFHTEGWGPANTLPFKIHRMLPKEGDREEIAVYDTDKASSFANANVRTLTEGDGDGLKLYWTKEAGINKEVAPPGWRLPLSGYGQDTHLLAHFIESDNVVYNTKDKSYHAFFGDVEVVTSEHGTLKGIFNHARDFEGPRFYAEEPEKEEEEALPLERFLIRYGHAVIGLPVSREEPKYVRLLRAQEEENKRKAAIEISKREEVTKAEDILKAAGLTGENDSKPSNENTIAELKPHPLITWNNFNDDIIWHEEEYSGFVYIAKRNLTCSRHNVLFEQHPDPWECGLAKTWAAYALACAENLEILSCMITNAYISYMDWGATCATHEADPHMDWCQWRILEFGRVATRSGLYFDISLKFECEQCGSRKELKKLPAWLVQMMERKEVTYYAR